MIAPSRFAEVLSEKITAAIEEETGRVALGSVEDWADYRERVGQIKGMRAVQRMIEAMTEEKP